MCGVCARVHVRLCVLTILFLLLSRADQNQAKNGNRGSRRFFNSYHSFLTGVISKLFQRVLKNYLVTVNTYHA